MAAPGDAADVEAYLRPILSHYVGLLGASTFNHYPAAGPHTLFYAVVARALVAEGGRVTDPGTCLVAGPITAGSAFYASVLEGHETLRRRLEAPVPGAVYVVFDAEINGQRYENTTLLLGVPRDD
jgi:hypothetical protein